MQSQDRSKRGRPSVYTDEIVDKICDRLATGESLRAICAEDGMPNRATVSRWLARYEEFRGLYVFVRQWQQDCLGDDIIVIADDVSITNAQRDLMINALKQRIVRLAPRKYGRTRC